MPPNVIEVSQYARRYATCQLRPHSAGFIPQSGLKSSNAALRCCTLPYDKALTSGVIRFDALNEHTKRAWLRAAAAVAKGR